MAVFTGYWIVFSGSAELIYEIRNWREGLCSNLQVYRTFQVNAGLKVWMEVQVEVGCACVV